jgi:hypothetical protein
MRWLFHAMLLLPVLLTAHPADISYLRVRVERQQADLRFTFNLFSLGRFIPGLDADQDAHLSAQELATAGPQLTLYLRQHVQMRVNGKAMPLPEPNGFEKIWPDAAAEKPVAASDYPARHVDISFRVSPQAVLNDLWLEIDLWQETGPLGSMEATYEQDDLRTYIPFSMSQPDYLYVTGYAVDDLFQDPAPAAAPVAMPWAAWLTVGGLAVAVFIVLKRH